MNKYIVKNNLPSIIAGVVLVIIVVLIFLSYQTYQKGSLQIVKLTGEIKQLDGRMKTIKTNKELGGEKINEYNKLLTQLIPESEDFFSIIYAFEQLSKETNFNITEYAINLSTSTKEKYALSVQGTGDFNSFMSFLKNYHFASGRLITNETIEFVPNTDLRKVSLALNVYNKKVLPAAALSSISRADMKLMDQIKNKVTIYFSSLTEEDVASYPTKDNPF